MLTIGQLAGYVGVTVRTVRHYHQLGLLPEPARDASGYRRYGADDVIMVRRISALARAGVPLARIASLLEAEPETFAAAIAEIDAELDLRIAELRRRKADLAQLPSAERLCIGDEVVEILDRERRWGSASGPYGWSGTAGSCCRRPIPTSWRHRWSCAAGAWTTRTTGP